LRRKAPRGIKHGIARYAHGRASKRVLQANDKCDRLHWSGSDPAGSRIHLDGAASVWQSLL